MDCHGATSHGLAILFPVYDGYAHTTVHDANVIRRWPWPLALGAAQYFGFAVALLDSIADARTSLALRFGRAHEMAAIYQDKLDVEGDTPPTFAKAHLPRTPRGGREHVRQPAGFLRPSCRRASTADDPLRLMTSTPTRSSISKS